MKKNTYTQSKKHSFRRIVKRIMMLATMLTCTGIHLQAQTQLIAVTEGGFENATSSFAANNWIPILPGIARQWQVGTPAGSVAGGTKAAYVGNAANYNGTGALQVGHFYRDIAIPAGATAVTLSFYHRVPTTDNTFDYFRVFTTTTSNTPVSGTSPGAGYTLRFENTATTYAAFTAMSPIDLTALAGTTVRLVFTNVSDGVTPAANFAVDNISLTYIPGTGCTGTPTAGTGGASPSALACSGTTTLSLTGSTNATGITYQWQSSPNNVTYTNIAGATTAPYTTGTISTPTYFRCVVGCTPSGLSANSTSTQVTVSAVAGGTTASSANPVCSGTSFTLSLTGATTTGVTYQWQSSPDNITYTNIAGATSATRAQTQTSSTYYRCAVTCTASATSANSTGLLVSVAGCVNMTNGSSTTCSSNFYDSGGPAANYANSETYVYTFYPNPGNSSRITWNSFVSESGYDYITIYNGPSTSSPVLYGPLSGTLSIPTFTSTDGSGALTFRFTSDTSIPEAGWNATVSCVANPPCSGSPAASTTIAASNPACYNTAFNLALSSSYILSGITFQWQSAPDLSGSPGTFTNVASGGNISIYSATQTTTTWYHCIVTCTNGGAFITSSDLKVTTNLCYCDPVYATGCALDRISNLVFNTLSNNTDATCSTSPIGLSVYGTSPASQTTSLIKGNSYTASITVVTGNANGTGVAIWIDYNDNGVFDASERSDNGATKFVSNTTGTLTVSVPGTAPTGPHRMRVRSMRNTNSNAIDPCLAGNQYGETEDYTVTVLPCGATAGGTTPICQFYNQNFTSTYFGTGTPVTYSWTGPNSFSASSQNTTLNNIQPTDAGTYTVTITDDALCVATGTITVAITPGPDVSANSNAPVCAGTSLSLTSDNNAAGQSSNNSFVWSGPNSYSSPQQNPTVTGTASAANAGSYSVIVTNQYLCTASASTIVVVNPNPIAIIASQTNVSCNGLADGAVDIDATDGFVNPDYLFTDGSGFNTDGIFTGYSAGQQTITAYDDYGCAGEITVTITEPPLLVASASSNSPICEGSDLNLTSSATGGTTTYSYAWTGPNTYTAAIDNPTLVGATPAAMGTYTVTITDAHGCTDDETASVTVVAAATPNAGPDQAVCAGTPITITGPFDGNASNTSVWSTNGDGAFNFPNALTAVYTPGTNDISNGTVVLTVTTLANGPCSSASDNMTVTINNVPASPAVVTGMPASVCAPVTGINLSIAPVATATSYNWVASPGTSGVSFTTPTNGTSVSVDLALVSNTTYTIRVYAVNGCGSSVGYNTANTRRAVSTPLNPSGPTAACANAVETYSIPSVTGADNYTWSGPAGSLIDGNPTPYTANVTSVNVTFPAGFTNGTVCVAASVACFTTVNKCISVSSGTAVVGAISGNATVCPGNSYTYSVATVAGAATYNWVLPANTSGSSSTNSINITVGAGFSSADIKVSVTTICGVTSVQKNKTITSGVPQRPASVTGPTNGLCNQSAVYNCPSQAGVTFTWTVPSGSSINNGQGTNAINAALGTFTTGAVCVSANNSCGSSADRCITIKGAPATPASITPNPASWCANASDIIFTADVSNVTGAYTLNWIYPGPTIATYVIGGGNSNSLTLDWITGTGNVFVTASNACGNGSRKYIASNSCRESLDYVQKDYTSDNVIVFPNPANNNITVSFNASSTDDSKITLSDITGRVIMSNVVKTQVGINNTTLDVSSLAKGSYIVILENKNGFKQSRIVIE